MSRNSDRRKFIQTGVAASAVATAGGLALPRPARAQWNVTPEKGASLRVLRWKRFV